MSFKQSDIFRFCFQYSLNDIHLALQLNYPQNVRYKLMQRAAQCHLKLGQVEDACRG